MILFKRGVLDENMVKEGMDYFILIAYYAMEEVLQGLSRSGHYDFDYFRQLALAVQPHYRNRSLHNNTLATALFDPL